MDTSVKKENLINNLPSWDTLNQGFVYIIKCHRASGKFCLDCSAKVSSKFMKKKKKNNTERHLGSISNISPLPPAGSCENSSCNWNIPVNKVPENSLKYSSQQHLPSQPFGCLPTREVGYTLSGCPAISCWFKFRTQSERWNIFQIT